MNAFQTPTPHTAATTASRRRFCAALALGACAPAARACVLRVGPGGDHASINAAARAAHDGATIEVMAGEYRADVALWTRNQLVIRAVGGRVRLVAAGASAEGKAIWVMRGGDIRVEGFDFVGARVADRNGAGIRLETGRLAVVDCQFVDNENGILTANDARCELGVERSLFRENGAGDGRSHNLYVGRIGALTVVDSAFHDARSGHLLKSRAARNLVQGCQFVDSDAGRSSYELEFPNGGITQVQRCRVRQGAATSNSTMVSYGVEGYPWPANELLMYENTLIDDRPSGGRFLYVAPGTRRVDLRANVVGGSSRTRATTLSA